MLVLFLLGQTPALMLLTLGLALYLTAIELRALKPPTYHYWIWWLLLVFLTHFVGYLILRAYSAYHRWQQKHA